MQCRKRLETLVNGCRFLLPCNSIDSCLELLVKRMRRCYDAASSRSFQRAIPFRYKGIPLIPHEYGHLVVIVSLQWAWLVRESRHRCVQDGKKIVFTLKFAAL